MKRRRRIIIILAAMGIFLAGAAVYLLNPPPLPDRRDEPLTQGQYMRRFIEEKDNAFHDYLIAERLVLPLGKDELSEELKKFSSGETAIASPALKDYIQKNQPAIDVIKKAIAKDYQGPEITRFQDFTPCDYLPLARIMVAQARLKSQEGHFIEACKEYLDVLYFSRNIPRNGSLIHGLVSNAINGLALEAMAPDLPNLDADTLEEVFQALEKLEAGQEPLSAILQREHTNAIRIIEYGFESRGHLAYVCKYFFNSAKPDKYETPAANLRWIYAYWNKNRIKKNINHWYEKAIQIADEPLKEYDEYREIEKEYKKDCITRRISLPLYDIQIRYARGTAHFRGARLRAAVELYQKSNHCLPDSLQDLIDAGILDQIPIDPFSNQPFQYLDNKIHSMGSGLPLW